MTSHFNREQTMKRIFITDKGDPSVGIGAEEWALEVSDEFWEVLTIDERKEDFLNDVRALASAWMGFDPVVMAPGDQVEAGRHITCPHCLNEKCEKCNWTGRVWVPAGAPHRARAAKSRRAI